MAGSTPASRIHSHPASEARLGGPEAKALGGAVVVSCCDSTPRLDWRLGYRYAGSSFGAQIPSLLGLILLSHPTSQTPYSVLLSLYSALCTVVKPINPRTSYTIPLSGIYRRVSAGIDIIPVLSSQVHDKETSAYGIRYCRPRHSSSTPVLTCCAGLVNGI